MRAPKLLLLSFGSILLTLPLWTHGGSCDADCEGENCTGGCEINSLACNISCVDDGCPGTAVCKEYGNATECFHSFDSKCEEAGGDQLPDGPETGALSVPPIVAAPEWAVLRYEERYATPVRRSGVSAVAASSWTFAERAVDDLVEDTYREYQRRLASRSSSRDADPPRPRPVTERLHFVVSPNAPCADVTMQLAPGAPERAFDGAATVFLRTSIDSGGRILGAEVLYSSAGDRQTRSMIGFLKAAATLRSTTGPDGPLEAFVVLFSHTGEDVGWIVSGSRRLL